MNFKVKYQFYSEEQGGRKSLPIQGYRSDFSYNEQAFMIHPSFEDEEGNLLEQGKQANESGVARMIILNQNMIPFHKENLHIGTKGFFIEGARKVAECEVIELF